ncbi:unnamed protein product [Periconia digitata]|uniref:Uncharacterized protein n=1 Tax=Periconia digitata TaxID=1303443 RepID=A0A9W4ULY6_9PLEO|nr:unnamed protein product [Periconia digitata]
MHFSIFATAVLSVAGIAGAVNTDKKSCEGGPWLEPAKAGLPWESSPENHYFCEGGHADGELLTGIRVWRGDWAVWGLQFQWGQGDFGKVYGDTTSDGTNRKDPDQELKWQPTDEVVIKLWDNKGKKGLDGVGWVQVWINGEKKLTQGSDHTGDERTFDAGSKKILAIQGKTASQAGTKGLIETLQFYYLESKIESTVMSKIEFTEDINKWNSEQKGIQKQASLGSIWFINENEEGGLNQTFGQTDTFTWTNHKTLGDTKTHTVGLGFGAKTSFEGGLPGVAKATTEVSFESKYEFQYAKTESNEVVDTHTLAYTTGSTVQGYPPQSATHCEATATRGTFDSDYVGEVTAKLANGKNFKYRQTGRFKSITYVDAVSSCKTMPKSQMPAGVMPKKGANIQVGKRAVSFRV